MTLLLHRGRLGIALGDDQPAQGRAMLARDFLPRRLTLVVAERDDAFGLMRRSRTRTRRIP